MPSKSWNTKSYTAPFNDFMSIIFNSGFLGLLLSIILGCMITYGVSGIVTFTVQIINTKEPLLARFNQYIIFNNITDGVSVVLVTYFVSNWLSRKIQSPVFQHIALSAIVMCIAQLASTVTFFLMGQAIFKAIDEQKNILSFDYQSSDVPWYWYSLGPLIVSNLFFYFQKKGKDISRKITEQELELTKLSELKTKAELQALEAKINPHFLYNSLNSVASLVHENPDKAEEMVLNLSKFYRYSTGRSEEFFDTLNNELEIVKTYLEVEKVRFAERLNYTIEFGDETLKARKIPRFLIQPIVENAIKHGISKIAQNGEIKIVIYEAEGFLQIDIHDNGPAFAEDLGHGYGLKSIGDKLRLLCGQNASVQLQNEPQKLVKLKIPISKS
jgi:two-component system, LytTR family, sensor kinase